jgi:hypothetical protein
VLKFRRARFLVFVSALVILLSTLFVPKKAQAVCGWVDQTGGGFDTSNAWIWTDPSSGTNTTVRLKVTYFEPGSPGVVARIFFNDTHTYAPFSWTITSSTVNMWYEYSIINCRDMQVHLSTGSSVGNPSRGVINIEFN